MNIKKFIFATISYVALSMALAIPWHMIWFHDLYTEMGAFTRSNPVMPLGMLSMCIQGAVIAYLYPLFYRGGIPVIQGIKFSLLMGLVVYSVMGFTMAAKIDINPIPVFLAYSAMFQCIQFTVTGTALGLIYGTKPKDP